MSCVVSRFCTFQSLLEENLLNKNNKNYKLYLNSLTWIVRWPVGMFVWLRVSVCLSLNGIWAKLFYVIIETVNSNWVFLSFLSQFVSHIYYFALTMPWQRDERGREWGRERGTNIFKCNDFLFKYIHIHIYDSNM